MKLKLISGSFIHSFILLDT